MRVLSAQATNFASYKELAFNFTEAGLTLIQGATGSGKSTLCDLIPWIAFGKTAKDGTVDEIRSWGKDEITKGTLWLQNVTITRIRGPKPKYNDLYFWSNDGQVSRGKDIPDTQRLINSLLNMDCDLYLAGAYFHEFSQTAQFFTTTAKNRRSICEQIVDLSLAQTLQPKLQDEIKTIKASTASMLQEVAHTSHELDTASRWKSAETLRASSWDKEHKEKWTRLETKYNSFEADKINKIKELEQLYTVDLKKRRQAKVCSECGAPKESDKHAESPYKEQIEREKASENNYLSRLVELESEKNPFNAEVKDFSDEINKLQSKLVDLKAKEIQLKLDLGDTELLQEVVSSYRSASIMNTIQAIEDSTNSLLSEHFDAEIKVSFMVADADKLDVSIYKDGNQCSYTQLSKGQRCLLKLCFGVSVMKCVSNHHGIKFHQLFFDEALSGLDDTLKTKAHGLFEQLALEYESIYIVEHSEGFKALLNNSYFVGLVSGESQIEKA